MATARLSPDHQIDLVRAGEFRLGSAEVQPGLLQIRHNGSAQLVEPRVMQMLVALHRANGGPVSRDDLIADCWGGLAVSDDAITQCVSKLRRALSGIAGVEVASVPRVGYRLAAPAAEMAVPSVVDSRPSSPRWGWAIGAAFTAALAILSASGVHPFRSARTQQAAAAAPVRTAQEQEADRLHTAAVKLFRERNQTSVAEAERLLRHAVALDPASAPGWARLGMAVFAPGWWAAKDDPSVGPRLRSEAIGYARRALAIDPNLSEAHQAMGFVLWSRASIPWLKRAVELDPNNGEAWDQLAQLQEQSGDLRTALVSSTRALEIDPTYARVIETNINLLHRLGRSDQAYQLTDTIANVAGRTTEANVKRCELRYYEGRFGDAMKLCADALAAGRPAPWFAEIKLYAMAYLVGDTELRLRFERVQPDLALITTSSFDSARALRLARTNPDEWWSDLFPGAMAKHLLVRGESRMLLALYDRRYGAAADFFDNATAYYETEILDVAPPLVIAMRMNGRLAEARQLRDGYAAAVSHLVAEGDRSIEVQLRLAQLAALDGDGAKAALFVRRAVALGWIGQRAGTGLPPDYDPVYASVRGTPEFRDAIAAYRAALRDKREAVLAAARGIPWDRIIRPGPDLRSNA